MEHFKAIFTVTLLLVMGFLGGYTIKMMTTNKVQLNDKEIFIGNVNCRKIVQVHPNEYEYTLRTSWSEIYCTIDSNEPLAFQVNQTYQLVLRTIDDN